jgi:hypothetical protein
MPINSRRKGHSFERDIVAEFRGRGWIRACRNIETDPDAILGIDLKNTAPFSIQCKRLADYAPISRIGEIPPLPGQIPVLITKPDDGPAMVVLPLQDFLAMISPDTNRRATKDDF